MLSTQDPNLPPGVTQEELDNYPEYIDPNEQ